MRAGFGVYYNPMNIQLKAPELENFRRPTAIIISLAATALLYGLITLVAVLSTPLEQLQGSKSALALIVGGEGLLPRVVTSIGMGGWERWASSQSARFSKS